MPSWFAFRPQRQTVATFFRVVQASSLLLPTLLLFIAAMRSPGGGNLMLWLGTIFQLLVCLLTSLSSNGSRQALGPSVVTLYLIALGWLWLGTPNAADWYLHLAKSLLLVVPLICFAFQVLRDAGVGEIRRAQILADRLARRKEWPSDLAACRGLPEVKALREAIQRDAAPALALLSHARAQVQVAALGALEFRKDWRPGQADLVLLVAQRARAPAVRAAAVAALGNVDDRLIIEGMAEFLRDPSREVRRAASESLLWDTEHRWAWIRHAVRRSLADPICGDDGGLRHEGRMLTAEAAADLTAWAGQKGLLAQRAALTLAAHYGRAMNEVPSEQLIQEIHRQLANPHAPAVFRLELARLLQSCGAMDAPALEQLLTPSNPAPLRLLAAEALLAGTDRHPAAVAALQQLARLPNREIALATAAVVQRRLGVDLGLALTESLPPVYSRQAAEIARRVMHWASQDEGRGRRSGTHDRVPAG
jgi:hypothetical protein